MIEEAIILAGGLGTRLRTIVSDRPKCLAEIQGKPFMTYLITYLLQQKINHFVFSLGYKHEMIIDFLKKDFGDLNYNVSIENEPMGTGGAVKLSCQKTLTKNILICNGDTFFKVDIQELDQFHKHTNADVTIALKPMINFSRYGSVELKGDSSIRIFKEKGFRQQGLINGGVYILNTEIFLNESYPKTFSFETDFLEKKVSDGEKIFGCIQDNFFIDIGIPEDYHLAQTEEELLSVLKKSH